VVVRSDASTIVMAHSPMRWHASVGLARLVLLFLFHPCGFRAITSSARTITDGGTVMSALAVLRYSKCQSNPRIHRNGAHRSWVGAAYAAS
jgi:hypothetical protein